MYHALVWQDNGRILHSTCCFINLQSNWLWLLPQFLPTALSFWLILMIRTAVEAFSQQFSNNENIESIMQYPHPFTDGGIVLVCRDDTVDFLDLLAAAYAAQPASLALHCLRRRELFQLSLPGLFAPPLQINERPHLPYWLKHKGTVLAGIDLRQEVELTVEPHVLLAGHIEGCLDYLRRYGILTSFVHNNSAALVKMLTQEMQYLMATALLQYGVWDISLATVPAQFAEKFSDSLAWQLWQQYQQTLKTKDISVPEVIDFVWLFEQFLHSLRAHIP